MIRAAKRRQIAFECLRPEQPGPSSAKVVAKPKRAGGRDRSAPRPDDPAHEQAALCVGHADRPRVATKMLEDVAERPDQPPSSRRCGEQVPLADVRSVRDDQIGPRSSTARQKRDFARVCRSCDEAQPRVILDPVPTAPARESVERFGPLRGAASAVGRVPLRARRLPAQSSRRSARLAPGGVGVRQAQIAPFPSSTSFPQLSQRAQSSWPHFSFVRNYPNSTQPACLNVSATSAATTMPAPPGRADRARGHATQIPRPEIRIVRPSRSDDCRRDGSRATVGVLPRRSPPSVTDE